MHTQIIVSIHSQYKILSCHPVCSNLLEQPQETNILTKKKKEMKEGALLLTLQKLNILQGKYYK